MIIGPQRMTTNRPAIVTFKKQQKGFTCNEFQSKRFTATISYLTETDPFLQWHSNQGDKQLLKT